MVVRTARGHFVTDREVEEHELAQGVARWMQVAPDCRVYVDDVLVSDEVRRVLDESVATPVATPAAAPAPAVVPAPEAPIGPEQLRSAAEAMQYAYSGVVKGYVDLLRFAQDFTRQQGELCHERERRSIDEAVRQRELTHKSLKDIDLVDRSVVATNLKECLAAAGAQGGARGRQDDRMRIVDLVAGVLKMIVGDRK